MGLEPRPESHLDRRYLDVQAALLAREGIEARSRYVQLVGPPVRTHLLEAGSGAPIVFVHGGGSFGAEWVGVMARLVDRFSLFAPDRPGNGLSDPFDYRSVDLRDHAVTWIGSLLDGLDLGRASLVGSSMGGYWTLAFALAHPQRVERLVLVGAPAGIDRSIPPIVRVLGIPIVNRLVTATVARPSLDAARKSHELLLVHHVERMRPESLELAYLSAARPGASSSFLTLLERALTIRGFRRELMLLDALPELALPTLFAWGDHDRFAPPSIGQRVAMTMPDARLEVVDDAGHLVQFDQPDDVATLIADFVGGA